jgi:hypothetical protein
MHVGRDADARLKETKMETYQALREIACVARINGYKHVDDILDAVRGGASEAVWLGRADADRKMGRDKLPQLAEPVDLKAECGELTRERKRLRA